MGLTREDIVSGRLEVLSQEEQERELLPFCQCREQRRISRAALLAGFAATEPVWLFGYGSLMWNPCIHYAERRQATVYGYRRNFCLRSIMGRGSPTQCGLVLGLEPGGSCRGVAFRLEPALAAPELDIVWDREMPSGAYVPRIVNLHTAQGPCRAITFVVNRQHPFYIRDLPVEQAAEMIAAAVGRLGPCADYLFSTVAHLDELGIEDRPLRRLRHLVEARRAVI